MEQETRQSACPRCGNQDNLDGTTLPQVSAPADALWTEDEWATQTAAYLCDRPECQPE